jgi:hypothetical protein
MALMSESTQIAAEIIISSLYEHQLFTKEKMRLGAFSYPQI